MHCNTYGILMLALEIQKLCKTYANGVVAVENIDLQVEQGDFFALLGPNGAGKSSTIGIVSSLVNKTSGSVKVFGYDLDTNLIEAKTCMGLVPQELNFNQFEKVKDIVINQGGFYGLSRRVAKQRAEKYLTQLGLWEKRNEVSRSLSGGMKRRLMIARALIHEPKMLILDEPTAGVDIELRRATWDFLQNINQQGTTIILTTHYLEEAEYLCDGIAIIDKGTIVERTKIKHLIQQLQSESLVLDLQHDTVASDLPVLENVSMSLVDSRTLEVTFPKSITVNTIFAQLSNKGIHIVSMRNKSNRLEELFLARVGVNLEA